MKKAYVFSSQSVQFVGMGKDFYDNSPKELFEKTNGILGYCITDIMFCGTDEEFKQTKVTRSAVFFHSVIIVLCLEDYQSVMTGHSLGEFSALVAAVALSFEDGLEFIYERAIAMQKACEMTLSTMTAIIALSDEIIEKICAKILTEVNVEVTANFNCPRQVAISGNVDAVKEADANMEEAGAKCAFPLTVSGGFHSPCMESARQELAEVIKKIKYKRPICSAYQNVDAMPHTESAEIKDSLLKQLIISIRWTQELKRMIAGSADTCL